MEECVPLGPEKTLEKLLSFGDKDLPVNVARWAWIPNEDPQVGAWRFRNHWLLHMVASKEPLREKLALFWHSHFAASDEKVEDGAAMLDYMQGLRRNPGGKFYDILQTAAKSTALLKMLDVRVMAKWAPNENFARELLELYTLGVGNYSEKDIKEVARALTGWSFIQTLYEDNAPMRSKVLRMARTNHTFSAYAFIPDWHDEGEKTVLGKKVKTGDDVLHLLADHPKTGEFVCRKLWEFFAYQNPEPSIVQRLAKVFLANEGDTKKVISEMVKVDEFWSPKCVRAQVKDPVQFLVGLNRFFNVGATLMARADLNGKDEDPVPSGANDPLGGLAYKLDVMRMNPLYPPGVEGWPIGKTWVTSDAMVRRSQWGPELQYKHVKNGDKDEWHPDEPLLWFVQQVRKRQPRDVQGLAFALCILLDVAFPEKGLEALVANLNKHGGSTFIENGDDRGLAWQLTVASGLIRSSPEFNLF
jgi:uncharacterized protein (DUF1800 family)